VSCEVTVARDLRGALEALARPGAPTQVLAGGTDLMVELRTGRARPERVVDVWKLDELRGVRAEAAGLRVHAYTSPHLVRFNERIRVAGELVADNALAAILEEVERPMIALTLAGTRGNQVRAAEILGLNRNTLRKKIQDLGVEMSRPRR